MRLTRCAGSVFVAAMLATSIGAAAQTFGYLGTLGPAYWAELSPEWTLCGSGETQSPVDFVRLPAHPASARKLTIDYSASTSGKIFNNGHTIEVEAEGANRLTLDGIPYELSQFHFHTASEHRVKSRGFDMELHLVHTAADGSNAVVAIFLERGSSSGALAPIFASLPDDLNTHHPLAAPFDPSAFLPASPAHFRYVGSLTTPPCTEGVQWVVMSEPVTVSDEDMAQFAARISFNARPVQREQ